MRVTRDDERARRVCSLALEFMSARAPVSSSDVARGFYADLSADSFRKAFARDRAVLAACGLSVVEVGRAEGEAAWGIDERRSYAEGVELSAGEAEYDGTLRLFRLPVEAVCSARLWAAADESGVFADFEVRGEPI